MVHAKNCETAPTFVEVIQRKLLASFFLDTVYNSYHLVKFNYTRQSATDYHTTSCPDWTNQWVGQNSGPTFDVCKNLCYFAVYGRELIKLNLHMRQ